ncbi:protein FANTASTIC FOUR 3-like [Phragmites australis]|uniref:protein FANTASTIC FOUR 3-like n=1 Tax=Phragmites australis TaxID=29695 RepID=UPI002D76543F|nr:protein FANTASTIC FOUR 3-like [Phragmites australis]
MVAPACAYGYERSRTPLMPATQTLMGSAAPTAPPPPPLPKAPPSLILPHHLGLCTEGLGSESSGDVDLGDVADDVGQALPCKRQCRGNNDEKIMVSTLARTTSGRVFPPPISVIGAGGKPWLYLRPHRGDGRLVLREVRIPSQELLQARREDGRFKLHFTHPEEEFQLADDHPCQGQELADAMVREREQKENE